MYNYNLQVKADALQQQLESLQAQKRLIDEQMSVQPPIVQNNYLPSNTPMYEFYGTYDDDIYNIRNIDPKVIYMDKDEPKFMMNGKFYMFEEFEPKSEIQILKEENEKLKKLLKEKVENESTIQPRRESVVKHDDVPIEDKESKWVSAGH